MLGGRGLGYANVVECGADPTGATDSSAAIQACIDGLKPNGGTLLFPPGTYLLATGLHLDLIDYTGGPLHLSGYGATLGYSGSGRAIEIRTNCSGLTGDGNAYQYAERSAHLAGFRILGTDAAEAGLYLIGASACSFRDLTLSGFTNDSAGAGSIVLWADYFHWCEQDQFDTIDIDDCCRGILFDMDPTSGSGGVFGGSNMNNSFSNVHIWVTQANGSGIEARRPTQWMGRNAFTNIVVHPMKRTTPAPAWDASGTVCFRLGTAYLRGTTFVACSGDVYGSPTGIELFEYDGEDPLTILGTQTDPPTYAGWTDATMFAGTTDKYNVIGHRNRFMVAPSGWVTVTNEAAAGSSVGIEAFGGGAGAVATLGAYGAGDSEVYSKLRLGTVGLAGQLWEWDHREDTGHDLGLAYFDGAGWDWALDIKPGTWDLYSHGHLVTKTYAGAPVALSGDGALAVDETNHLLYFQAAGAWYSAGGGGGGSLPGGGTTAQFLRGDSAWSDTLTGPLTVTGLTVGSLGGVLKAASGVVSGSATTTDLPEGSNLYYTTARVAAYLAGLSGTDDTTTFLRGDVTWSNALTGGLRVDGGIGIDGNAGTATGLYVNRSMAGAAGSLSMIYAGGSMAATANNLTMRGLYFQPSLSAGGFTGHTAYAGDFEVSAPAGFATAYGVYGAASGAATNWAGYFGAGDVKVTNGLNVGSASGAAAGEAKVSTRFYAVGASVASASAQTNISAYAGNGLRIDGSVAGVAQDAIAYQSAGGGAAIAFRRDGAWGTFIDFYTNNAAVAGAISRSMTLDNLGGLGVSGGGDVQGLLVSNAHTTYTTAHTRLESTSATGQVPLEWYINGTVRGKVRADYIGNMNYISNGGGHNWFTGGDAGTGSQRLGLDTSGHLSPGAHNTQDLGTTALRWRDVWCQRGAFNGSSRALKADIEPLEPARALALALGTPIYTYRYRSGDPDDAGADFRHAGYMADEVDRLLSPDGRSVTPGTAVAVAMAAIGELERRLRALEGR